MTRGEDMGTLVEFQAPRPDSVYLGPGISEVHKSVQCQEQPDAKDAQGEHGLGNLGGALEKVLVRDYKEENPLPPVQL